MNYIERYWRDATPADAIREPPIMARFRNYTDYDWRIDFLTGIRCNHDYPWYSVRLGSHKHCQVYDAPDPGEGWRLIDPEKDKPQEGDEIYDRETCTWRRRLTKFQSWALSINRRRIEQPKPEPRYEPFRWEDREQLRGRWIGSNDGCCERLVYVVYREKENFYINSYNPKSLCNDWHFLDTGEPVGRRVE